MWFLKTTNNKWVMSLILLYILYCDDVYVIIICAPQSFFNHDEWESLD